MAWLSSGRVPNPIIDQVIIDSGPLTGGSYFFDVFASSTVNSALEVQLRDATNTITLKSQIIAAKGFATSWGFSVPSTVYLEILPNQRIRVIQAIAAVGSVSVSMVGNF